MTTLQLQSMSYFQVPAAEDPMELTSDIDRRAWADDDVDIDLDLAGDNVHDGEDEYMGEEDIDNVTDLVYTSGQDLHACKDDEMADGDYTEQQNDERSSLYDEDIEDAELGGPTIDEDTAVQTLLEKADKVSPKTYDDAEDFSATGITESNFPGRASSCEVSEANLDGVGEVRSEEELEIGSSNHDDDKPERQEASHDNDDTLEGECMFDHGDVDHTVEIIDGKAISQASIEPDESVQVNHPGPSKEEHVAQFDGNEESAASVPEDAQAKPTSETAAYLHPVIVVYQDTEISLFPPLEQGREHTDTYFLHDEQMAGESIKNLLGACRSVLGDSITEQEELVVNIDDLDLHISESTTESSTSSLAQLLDIYVRLQHNDGLQDPPPLYMNLTTRRKFSHRLDALLDAVVEGKGLSQLKSLDEAEDVQLSGAQYQSQHSPESQDTGLEANGLMKVQDTSETYEKDDSDNEPLPSADFAVDNHSKPQDTETSISSDAVDGGVMGGANARLRPQEPGVSNGAAIELVDDEALQSKLSATASLQPSVNETQPKRQDQSVVDDGDFVDYDDEDDEHTHATSSGSSTLQGDSFDATADSDHSSSGLAKPIVEDQELKFPANDSENIAEKERNIPSREEDEFSAISAIVHKHPRGDIAREDLQDFEENEKFSQEASGDEEELQSHQDVETSSKTYPQYINIANHNGDGEPSQGEDEAGSYDCEVFQESAEQSFIPVGPATFNGDGEDHQAINYAGPKDRYSDAFQYEHLSITNDLGVGGELLEAHTTSFDNDDDNNNQHPAEGNLKVTVLAESFENSQDDEDEITYEDEDNNLESPVEPLNAGPVSASSPGSLKRARYPSHDDDDPEQVFQGAKRVRSK